MFHAKWTLTTSTFHKFGNDTNADCGLGAVSIATVIKLVCLMPLNVVSTLDPFFKIKSPHLTGNYHNSLKINHQFPLNLNWTGIAAYNDKSLR